MSSVHRILTGLEFVLDQVPGHIHWPAETEDLVRLSFELARSTRSRLAFAAVAIPPAGEVDCRQVDTWLAVAEQQLGDFCRSANAEEFPIEQAAWLGNPAEEWTASAQDSEMDLLIVWGSKSSGSSDECRSDLSWPERASCPVWFAGREPDRLAAEPPLIAFCDDFSDEAAMYLPFAVELALAWNARLLIVHPRDHSDSDLTRDADDELRREIFTRLSRTDFRAIPHGSQLRFVVGKLEEILTSIGAEQAPNLVLASVHLAKGVRPPLSGHLFLWAKKSPN